MESWRKLLTKNDAAIHSTAKLAAFRKAGIAFVQICGGDLENWDCKQCVEMRGKPIPIDAAPPLPLAGCERPYCGCSYRAVQE